MLKLAVVGDLSQNDPARLGIALDAAAAAADYVIQCGDVNPGYPQLAKHLAAGRCFAIPGNHDIQGPGNWDANLPGAPKQWRHDIPAPASVNGEATSGACLIGLNNSLDTIDAEGWALLNGYIAKQSVPLFVFVHKSISPIVLPDGSESQHIMGEGAQPCGPAIALQTWLAAHEVTIVCGHYHGWTLMDTWYGTVIVEGRGGAASQIGYTLIYVQPDGWTAHPVVVQ